MAQAKQWDEWDRVSMLALVMASPYSKRQLKMSTFHPFLGPVEKKRQEEFQAYLKRVGKSLPKKLTEEEKRAYFKKLFERIRNGKRN